jgi:hypothetical protein
LTQNDPVTEEDESEGPDVSDGNRRMKIVLFSIVAFGILAAVIGSIIYFIRSRANR